MPNFDEILERKKQIFETAWLTFFYLLKNNIEPTPENYAKYFRRIYKNPEIGLGNPVKKIIRKTEHALEESYKTLDEIEQEAEIKFERDIVKLLEDIALKAKTKKFKIEKLQQEIKKLEEELEAVRREKYIDPLTGVWNRLALEEFLEQMISLSMERDIVVAFLDLNKFKQINDTYGHIVGDKVLKEFAKYITSNLKRKDFFARYGGDEFIAILFDVNLATAKDFFERLRKHIPKIKVNEKEIKVDFCVGLTIPYAKDKPQNVIARADRAMYECKKTGKVEIAYK
jgi:diguanylate cyclase (GGDEF)-like protein